MLPRASLAISIIFVGLLNSLQAFSQNDDPRLIQLLRADLYTANDTGCGGPHVSIPFALPACNKFGESLSWQVNCTSQTRDVYTNADCSGSPSVQGEPFSQCLTFPDALLLRPSVSFSCGYYPRNRTVIVTKGGACPRSNATRWELPSVEFSYALVVNTCLRIPKGIYSGGNNGIASVVQDGFYRISVKADKTITLNAYLATDSNCRIPVYTLTGHFGACTAISGSGLLSGRLLQSGGLVFDSIDGSTTLEVDNASTSPAAGVVTVFILLMSFILTQTN